MKKSIVKAIEKLVEETADKPKLVTVSKAARILGCSRLTVYHLLQRGELKTAGISAGRRRVTTASIDAFIERGGVGRQTRKAVTK